MKCTVARENRRRRAAFTLVELLVCISIVSILMAILLPALVRARASARKTACISNLRQIAMSMEMFRQDKGSVPSGDGSNLISTPTGAVGLGRMVPEYLRDIGVLYCPAASRITEAGVGARVENIGKAWIRSSYCYQRDAAGAGRFWDYNGEDNSNHSGEWINYCYVGDGARSSVPWSERGPN